MSGFTGTPQLFQTFFHGRFSAFETTCLRSFIDHGHRVRVYAYDHSTTPDFCEQADAREILLEARVFFYRKGFGAGSVSAFSNLFRYALLLRHGGWWIDTDVACVSAAWPRAEIVAAAEDDDRIGTAVLHFPPGHKVMEAAVAACTAAGEAVNWGQTGPGLFTKLARKHNLMGSLQPSNLFYPLHWSEWLDLIDPAGCDVIEQRIAGAAALHLWSEKFVHYGFQRNLAPLEGSFLHRLAVRHETVTQFTPSDRRALQRQIELVRNEDDRSQTPAARLPRRCVYTALTGAYEKLNEQPAAKKSSIPFICFTDDPGLTSKTWEIRPLKLLLGDDYIRSQRDCKLRPHRFLPDFDASLYIDNSVLLKVPPEEIFDAVDLSSGLAMPLHSYRDSVRDEFARVRSQHLDDPARIAEQLDHYSAENPEILEQRPFWAAIMLRDHHNAAMIAAMELWFAHVLRYSRRDQLSNRFVFSKAGLAPHAMEIDNFESRFHTWPNVRDRKLASRTWEYRDNAGPSNADFHALESRYYKLLREHQAILASTTWRMMEPLRTAANILLKWRR